MVDAARGVTSAERDETERARHHRAELLVRTGPIFDPREKGRRFLRGGRGQVYGPVREFDQAVDRHVGIGHASKYQTPGPLFSRSGPANKEIVLPPNLATRMDRLRDRQDLGFHDEQDNEYWYRPSDLLVRHDAVDRFRGIRALARLFEDADVEGVAIRRFRLRDGQRLPTGTGHIPQLLEELAGRGFRDAITPNHVLTAAPPTAFGPAMPAAATDELMPALVPPTEWNSDFRVGVLDSGVRLTAHPQAAEHAALALDPQLDEDALDQNPLDGMLDDADVHGSFVADLIRLHAPQATVRVGRVLLGGLTDEVVLAQGMARMRAAGVQVLNLSLYGYTNRNRQPLVLREALNRLPATMAVVAAAGNDGLERRTWPAAFDRVIGVGAVDGGRTDGNGSPTAAAFTNRGTPSDPWIDACADGVEVLSSYVVFDETGDGAQSFTGSARWSGTSFSTPRVAAAIIERAMATGRNDAAAVAQELLAEPGRTKVRGLGVYIP
jgi:hypothetical protein